MQTNRLLFVSFEDDSIKVRTDLFPVVSVSYQVRNIAGRGAEGAMEALYIPASVDFPLQAFSVACLWENLRLLCGPDGVQGVCVDSAPVAPQNLGDSAQGKQTEKENDKQNKRKKVNTFVPLAKA